MLLSDVYALSIDETCQEPSEILPNLFLCGIAAIKPELLERLDVRMVLNLCNEVKRPSRQVISGVLHCHIPTDDSKNYPLCQHFDECNALLDTHWSPLKGSPAVIVHCLAGASRSPTVLIAFLMWKYAVGVEQAHSVVATRRGQRVHPNEGFMQQLRQYEENGFKVVHNTSSSVWWWCWLVVVASVVAVLLIRR